MIYFQYDTTNRAEKQILPVFGGGIMIDFFKKLMEQALDLELTVRFTKRDG